MRLILLVLAYLILLCGRAAAQDEGMQHMHHDTENMGAGDSSKHMQTMSGMLGPYPATRESSGTSWQPDSSPMEALHFMKDDWMLMVHGFVNGIYDHQGGPRGADKTFSTSMLMLMAEHQAGPGKLGLRGMFSLDPAMGKAGYPLLLQTGETADGRTPLIDRQHPHDLFMELAASYTLNLPNERYLYGYFGLPGEPALGPPTFMHRFSGVDIPEAPITHHWLDSTHITFGVFTVGYGWKDLKVEGSVFKGREPDENRWNIESPKFDSYSARISYNPLKNWAFQASAGHIHSPEELHPDVDTNRYTASAIYNQPFSLGNWQTTLAWGRDANDPGNNLDGILLESTVSLKEQHTFFGRLERVQKDELFLEGDPREGSVFKVSKVSLGYIFDFLRYGPVKFGAGGLYSWHFLPAELDPVYGTKPRSVMVFIRAKLVGEH